MRASRRPALVSHGDDRFQLPFFQSAVKANGFRFSLVGKGGVFWSTARFFVPRMPMISP